VCSDWHVPGESNIWVSRLIKYLKDNKIKTLIIGGDFWNFDALSRFVIKDRKMNLADEIERGLEILNTITKIANVYLVRGNHDRRIVESFDGELSEWMDSFGVKNLTVTDNDHLYLVSNGIKWRVCHPEAYSRVKGNVVKNVSLAKREHIISGHAHYLFSATETTGKFMAIDSGCLCDQSKFAYKREATNPLPEWENGFLHIKEGKFRLISENSF
jgi:predicted phosphodiesterase